MINEQSITFAISPFHSKVMKVIKKSFSSISMVCYIWCSTEAQLLGEISMELLTKYAYMFRSYCLSLRNKIRHFHLNRNSKKVTENCLEIPDNFKKTTTKVAATKSTTARICSQKSSYPVAMANSLTLNPPLPCNIIVQLEHINAGGMSCAMWMYYKGSLDH